MPSIQATFARMHSHHVWTGNPQQDQAQAEAYAQQCRAGGMTATVTPHPQGGLLVQAWHAQQPAPHAQAPYSGHAQAPYSAAPAQASHAPAMGPGPVAAPQPKPPKEPSGFVRFIRAIARERKGFNGVGAVVGLLFGLPIMFLVRYVRFDEIIAMSIAGGLALLVTVAIGWGASVSWGKVVMGALIAPICSSLVFYFHQPDKAYVIVDNRSGKSLYLFADGERLEKVAANSSALVQVDGRTEKIGWGTSKKKPKTKKKVSLGDLDHYLLSPEGGRCYLMVTTSYSLTGLEEPVHDEVKWLPAKTWQKLSPAPDVEFGNNPQSITSESSHPVSRALRRSLGCSTLAKCSKADKKALTSCYSRAKGEDDFNACGADATKRCKPGT